MRQRITSQERRHWRSCNCRWRIFDVFVSSRVSTLMSHCIRRKSTKEPLKIVSTTTLRISTSLPLSRLSTNFVIIRFACSTTLFYLREKGDMAKGCVVCYSLKYNGWVFRLFPQLYHSSSDRFTHKTENGFSFLHWKRSVKNLQLYEPYFVLESISPTSIKGSSLLYAYFQSLYLSAKYERFDELYISVVLFFNRAKAT